MELIITEIIVNIFVWERRNLNQHFRDDRINKLWIKFHHFSHCEVVLKAMDTSYNIGNEMDQFNQYMYKVFKAKFKTY